MFDYGCTILGVRRLLAHPICNFTGVGGNAVCSLNFVLPDWERLGWEPKPGLLDKITYRAQICWYNYNETPEEWSRNNSPNIVRHIPNVHQPLKDVQFILTNLWLKYYDCLHKINEGYSAALQGIIFFPKALSLQSLKFNNSRAQFLISLCGSFVRLCLNSAGFGPRQSIQ